MTAQRRRYSQEWRQALRENVIARTRERLSTYKEQLLNLQSAQLAAITYAHDRRQLAVRTLSEACSLEYDLTGDTDTTLDLARALELERELDDYEEQLGEKLTRQKD